MMKPSNLLVAGVAALLPFAAALAQSPTPDPAAQPAPAAQPEQRGATFESLDTDSDGRISKTEAEANENVKAQFTKYDQNGDGFIEREEVASANKPQSEPAPQPQQ